MRNISGYFTFVVFSVLGIVGWIFNWLCWKKKMCCFKVYHNPIIQRIVWWFSFLLLCGILACSISGIVVVVRFGKYTRAAQCGYERIYYDSQFGQLKDSYPRWEGLYNNSMKLNNSLKFINTIENLEEKDFKKISPFDNWTQNSMVYLWNGKYSKSYIKSIEDLIEECNNIGCNLKVKETGDKFYNCNKPNDTSTIVGNFMYESHKILKQLNDKYDEMEESIDNIQMYGYFYNDEIKSTVNDFEEISLDLKNYQTGYLDKVKYYIKVAKGCGYILVIIYLSILAIISIFGCALLLIYAYLENQKNLDIFMHIIWNCIRFFYFFFFYIWSCFWNVIYRIKRYYSI